MGHRQFFNLLLLALAVTLIPSRLVRAQTARPLPVRISYVGDPSCGSAQDFRQAIHRRAPELEDAGEQEPARQFAVAVTVDPGGVVRGSAEISDPSGARTTRQLNGNDCEEVREALAFIVAELARADRLESDHPQAAEPDRRSIEAPPRPVRAPLLAAPASLARSGKPHSRSRLRWELGTGLEAIAGPLPRLAPAPLGFLEADLAPDRSHVLGSLRVSALRAKSGAIHGTIGDAEMRWESLRAELCVPRVTKAALWASPCAAIDVGWLSARGSRAQRARTQGALWLAPGVSARAAFMAFGALLIEADAGTAFPLVRPRFYFGGVGDDETVHAVRSLCLRAGLSLGVLFW